MQPIPKRTWSQAFHTPAPSNTNDTLSNRIYRCIYSTECKFQTLSQTIIELHINTHAVLNPKVVAVCEKWRLGQFSLQDISFLLLDTTAESQDRWGLMSPPSM